MSKELLKVLPELTEKGIISPEIAGNIQAYFHQKEEESPNRLFAIFGIFGALLVGLGLILIIAHNWDQFGRRLQLTFAFMPLLIAQLFCMFTLWKKSESLSWKESSATFLVFAIGASLSLISQIYHLPGEMGDYVFSWMLLILPLIYILPSLMTGILYLIGITYLGLYWGFEEQLAWPFWIMLLALLPHYLFQQKIHRNYHSFSHYLIPISAFLGLLGSLEAIEGGNGWTPLVFMALFGIFQGIGSSSFIKKSSSNGYALLSILGATVLLLLCSFEAFWVEEVFGQKEVLWDGFLRSEIAGVLVVMSILYAGLSFWNFKTNRHRSELMQSIIFPVFGAIFLLGTASPGIATLLVNLLILLVGVAFIREGVRRDSFGIMNYGLLVLTALIACRFFDINLSFVFRGIAFILLGMGFFAANYVMYQRLKTKQ